MRRPAVVPARLGAHLPSSLQVRMIERSTREVTAQTGSIRYMAPECHGAGDGSVSYTKKARGDM